MCVGLTLAAVVGWLAATKWLFVAHSGLHTVASSPSSAARLFPSLFRRLRRPTQWEPVSVQQQYGALFEALRGKGTTVWWRWTSLAALLTVSGVTGATSGDGVSPQGGACTTSLAVSAALLVACTVCFAVVRPYAVPTENLFHPFKFALLAVTSIILLLEIDDEPTALMVLGLLQVGVTVARVVVRVFLFLAAAPPSSTSPSVIVNDGAEGWGPSSLGHRTARDNTRLGREESNDEEEQIRREKRNKSRWVSQ